MKELIECILKEGSYAFINEDLGWGRDSLIPGYLVSKNRREDTTIEACNGEKLEYQSATIRRGNHLTAALRVNGAEKERLFLGDLFPNQVLVIATCCESLQFFAPICSSKRELIKFLSALDEICTSYKDYYDVQGKIEKLAVWLYQNNPDKVIEGKWDI